MISSSSSLQSSSIEMLEQRDAIGQLVAVAPAALVERRALVQAEQDVVVVHLHLVEQLVRRLVLDRRSRGCGPAARTSAGWCRWLPRRARGNTRASRAPSLPGARPERGAFFEEEGIRVERAAAFALAGLVVNPSADRNRSRCARCRSGRAASACRSAGRAGSRHPRRASSAAGGSISHNCASTLTGSSFFTRPMRLATRSTCRSTGRPGTPSA